MKHEPKPASGPGLSRRAVLQGAAAVSLVAGMGGAAAATPAKIGTHRGESVETRRLKEILARFGPEFGEVGGLE